MGYPILTDIVADPLRIREYAVDAATVIAIGDLCWLDADDVKPASHTNLWTGSLAGARGKLAEWFVGVALSAHAANAREQTVRVASQAVVRMSCDSSTFEIGDLVGGMQDGSSSFLKAQHVGRIAPSAVTGTFTTSMAIGRVSKREATAVTIVNFEIMGRGVAGGGLRAFLTS